MTLPRIYEIIVIDFAQGYASSADLASKGPTHTRERYGMKKPRSILAAFFLLLAIASSVFTAGCGTPDDAIACVNGQAANGKSEVIRVFQVQNGELVEPAYGGEPPLISYDIRDVDGVVTFQVTSPYLIDAICVSRGGVWKPTEELRLTGIDSVVVGASVP